MQGLDLPAPEVSHLSSTSGAAKKGLDRVGDDAGLPFGTCARHIAQRTLNGAEWRWLSTLSSPQGAFRLPSYVTQRVGYCEYELTITHIRTALHTRSTCPDKKPNETRTHRQATHHTTPPADLTHWQAAVPPPSSTFAKCLQGSPRPLKPSPPPLPRPASPPSLSRKPLSSSSASSPAASGPPPP